MQSTEAVKNNEIKAGKYEFLIKSVLKNDKNGYELKTKNGLPYTNLMLILIDGNGGQSVVYKAIFGEKDLKEVVLGIGNPALTHVYNLDPENFDKEVLVGEVGSLFLGQKNGYANIECFIKPKPWAIPVEPAKVPSENVSLSNGFGIKEALEDGVPF